MIPPRLMASLIDHLRQAQHNEALAGDLDSPGGLKYRDWLITVAFYAAVHYVEALFTTVKTIGHTETACPASESRHRFRQEKVQTQLGKKPWESYRKLRIASEDVRYLYSRFGKVGTGPDYYDCEDAKRFFRHDLKVVRDAVGRHINIPPV
jgi:hypothetical protein